MKHAKVIVNPVAGANSTHRKWPWINSLLKNIGLKFDFQFTEGRGHGIQLAREAAVNGYDCLVAVGGDGTIHEVANGILQAGKPTATPLGIVCTGTGSDLARSVGIPHDPAHACSALTGVRRMLIDVGLVKYQKKGQTLERYFVNSAGVGFDATVVASTDQLPKYFGGTIPYVTGLLRSLLSYRNKTVTFKIGDRAAEKARILSVVVANGRFFGGGMNVAPEAKLDDNLLDMVIVGNFGKLELLRVFSKVYKGTHLSLSKVRLEKGTAIQIESTQKFLLHADGELLGEGPVSFSLLPKALTLVV